MKLIVTEKNQTARRIADILSDGKAKREGGSKSTLYTFNENGEDVRCLGMRGHILEVDFPEEYQKWRQVEPRELIDAKIVKIPIDKALVTTLKKVARKADSVVIATDYDREGELIGFDIQELIKEVNPGVTFSRALFSALTETQIREAFATPGCLQENLARAGETRQDIDLIWGAVLTRFISLATKRGGKKFLSAGRVQSPTLTLLVDREQEIKKFVPEDFWVVSAVCEHDGDRFTARHKVERFTREEDARAAFDHIAEEGKVTSVKTRERKMKPPAPFNTTSFLAAASTLKISPAQAMRIAESLYTRGIISYPRVDNTVYPESLDLREVLRSFSGADVVGSLAGELLKKKRLSPTRGKKRSTDHPPIYPTGAAKKGKLKGPEWRIYELVARRFMATLSEPALARSTVVALDIGGEPFVARGDVILDEGFLRFYPYSRRKDDELPQLDGGDMVRVVDREIEGKQTQPPARYTQSKLIMKMEELSLGTKSTRHNIIQGLADREYASGNPLKPSDTGIAVASTLERHATLVTTPEMTAQLEQDMDSIVEGRQSFEGVVDTSREILKGILETMEERKEEISREIREGMRGAVLGACPDCGKGMTVRKASRSGNRFAGCSGFPGCKRTLQLPQKGEITALGESCPECGNPRIRLELEGSKRFEFCLNPECPTNAEVSDQAMAKILEELQGPAVLGACPDCGKDMILRKASRSGNRFAGCSGFPGCKRTLQLPQKGEITALGESCPECGNPRIRLELEGSKRFEFCLNPECPTNAEVSDQAMAKILEELQGPAVLGACPDCGKDMILRKASRSGNRFAGCSGFPGCKRTLQLPQKGEITALGESCPECGNPRIRLELEGSKRFEFCLNPECPTNAEVSDQAMAKILEELQGPAVLGACPDCGGKIRVRKGKKSGNRFAGCDGYPKCRVSYQLPQEGEIKQSGENCDECGAPIVLLDQKGRKPRKMCINRECETNSE